MAKFTLTNVRGWIDEYVDKTPGGIDVTAFVLDRMGREDMEAYAKAANVSPDQAKQEIGATVKEMLLRKYPASEQLHPVPVNAAKWPNLAGWVGSYTTYRIAR